MAGKSFDVAVVGGGPGGYVAAIRAAQLGLATAVVERERLGGVCLNWGCIPTKTLLRSAEVLHLMQRAADFGLKADNIGFDAGKIVERSRKVADRLSKGVGHLLKKNDIAVFGGEGRLAGGGGLVVTGDGEDVQELSARHVVLATGARVRRLPRVEPDGDVVWTYKEAMTPDAIPGSILVIGAGAIGVEFASFYRDMGSDVTVVEIADRILPAEDGEIAEFARKAFEKRGMRILTGARVEAVRVSGSNAKVDVADSQGETRTFDVDKVVLAAGVVGNVENLGLENSGVETDRGHVVVDEWLETGEPGVYAIGDLVGPPWLAHKASHEGVVCVEKIAGLPHVEPLETLNIPGCTYCSPQIASVGLSEDAAREAGRDIRVGRFPFIGNGKALALGDDQGLVKTVFDAGTGELLGAHMVGAEVTELVQGFAIARELETTEAELIRTIFPHPTLSETMHEAVLAAYGRALHI